MAASTPFATPHELPAGVVLRHVHAPDDYPAMNDIANEIRVVTGQAFYTTVEAFARYYDNPPGFDRDKDVVVIERDGVVLGYARAGHRVELGGLEIYEVISFMDPARVGGDVFVAAMVVIEARMREMAATRPPAERTYETFGGDEAVERDRLLRSIGYEPVRWFFTMVRPNLDDLPGAPLPEGLEIRDVTPLDVRAIWDAEQEAFQDDWGYVPATERQFEEMLADPFRSDIGLWRVAWDGDQVAGAVRSYIDTAENEAFGRRRGYVEHISVRRPWRRRGLARALIAASFPLLRARGMTEGALGVDTENLSGALRLYEACGFRPVARTTTYRKPMP